MRGHYGAAIMHITSGLKILSELRSKSPNSSLSNPSIIGRTSYVPIDVLCGLFSRLQAQATVTTYQTGGTLFNIWPELVIDPTKPVIFNSLSDAREMLEIYTFYYKQRSLELHSQSLQGEVMDTTIQQSVTVTSLEAIALRDFALTLLENWSAGLEKFLHENESTFTDRDRRGAAVLQLRKIDSIIALDIIRLAEETTPDDHMEWDKYCPHFEQVVSLGESIIASPSSPPSFSPSPFSYSSSHPSPFTTTFSLDLGIVGSLFNVAARCRDPGIRRRAVYILRTAAVQEGIWNSAVVGAVAEKWIEIEEEGLGVVNSYADVPASARLAYFLPVFDIDRRSAVVYFSRVSGVSGVQVDSESVRTETFQW
ncbi:uncharacterized protein N7483_008746 [Penicillium malachiteum]|uniref:uncharacterized protein n=1 Tax=Penicillium malachiteum TaxID=1324776 RepID=UPI0025468CFE|nr:uncharacterized protein N7483_008746 [Penicillium malachiteum]KAJ5720812.1 hypothetical protein N7483_008746 [Penicillium malachiteum]